MDGFAIVMLILCILLFCSPCWIKLLKRVRCWEKTKEKFKSINCKSEPKPASRTPAVYPDTAPLGKVQPVIVGEPIVQNTEV